MLLVITMSKMSGIAKGLYGLVVGVSCPKIRQEFYGIQRHKHILTKTHTHTKHTNKTIREISFFALIHPTCRLTHSMCTGLRKQFYTQQEMNVNSRFQTFAVFFMLYVFFWVIPRRLDFICRRFGTLFHLHRQVGV